MDVVVVIGDCVVCVSLFIGIGINFLPWILKSVATLNAYLFKFC